MARPRRRNYYQNLQNTRQRDGIHIASDFTELLSVPIRDVQTSPVRSLLSEVEDWRTFAPDEHLRPARSSRRRSVTVTTRPATRSVDGRYLAENLMFSAPKYVAVCVRRKQRREVIHALKRAGRGKKRPPRRNRWSGVHC